MCKILIVKILGIVIATFVLNACSKTNEEYSPKPRGFNRIDLPTAQYQQLAEEHPYTFEYSKYAIVQPDTFRNAEPHWIILYYPKLNSRIQFTY